MSRVREKRYLTGFGRIIVCWRGLFSLAVALVVILLIASPFAHAQGPNMTYVHLTEEFLNGPRSVSAFVETNSDSQNILCTLQENYPYFGPLRLAGLVIMCRYRQLEDGRNGVNIFIVLPVLFETRQGLAFDLTLFQDGAAWYREPVPCPEC